MFQLLKSELYIVIHELEIKLFIICILGFVLINLVFGGYDGAINLLETESREIFALILCIFWCNIFLHKSFNLKTIYHVLVSGKSRKTIFYSKFVAYEIISLFLILFNNLAILLLYGIGYGIGEGSSGNIITYMVVGGVFDLCIVLVPFILMMLIRNNTIAFLGGLSYIAIIIMITQMSWNEIAINLSRGTVKHIDILVIFIVIALGGVGIYFTMKKFEKQDVL